MLLSNKTALIYGAAGSLGSAIAKGFAREGAEVIVTGPHEGNIVQLAETICAEGGKAVARVVDALDEKSVAAAIAFIVQQGGSLDISFNLIDLAPRQGAPLVEFSLEEFTKPIFRTATSHFITGTAAGRVMMKQRAGVILSLTATPGGIGYPHVGGFGPACHLIENLCVALGTELGAYGVRTANIRSGGSPDSQVFAEAIRANPDIMRGIMEGMNADTMLKRMPPMADIVNTALFLASSMAAGITGVTVDVTCGTTAALNHRTSTPF